MKKRGHVRKVRGCGRLTHWLLWHLRHVCTQESFHTIWARNARSEMHHKRKWMQQKTTISDCDKSLTPKGP